MKYTRELIERLEQEMEYIKANEDLFHEESSPQKEESNTEKPHINSPEFLRQT